MDENEKTLVNLIHQAPYSDRDSWNELILKNQDFLIKEFISKSSIFSFEYAKSLKKPFPLGEISISNDAEKSYKYAKEVLGERFELGEETILKKPSVAYKYAKDIIKGRWEPIEKILLSSTEHLELVCEYSINVVKGRWEEAEEIIKNSFSSFQNS